MFKEGQLETTKEVARDSDNSAWAVIECCKRNEGMMRSISQVLKKTGGESYGSFSLN